MPAHTLAAVARSAVLGALAVVLPVACSGCGAPDRPVCRDCLVALEPSVVTRRLEGAPGESFEVVAGLTYEGVARRCILALKEEGRTDVIRALAVPLARAISAACESHPAAGPQASRIVVCPVPQSARSERARGYDPVRMLARRATGLPVRRMLRHRGAGPAQKLLGVEERRVNIEGAMLSLKPLDGAVVLLVDDVVTSGATLVEAARAVATAGGSVIGAAVVAATPRRLHESAKHP